MIGFCLKNNDSSTKKYFSQNKKEINEQSFDWRDISFLLIQMV